MTRERNAATAAELVERDAWLDMFAAAPPSAATALTLSSRRIGGMGLLASGTVAITEFNRAMAAGIETPMTDADLRRATAWFAERSVPSWAVQVSPAAGEHVHEMLAQSGAVTSGNGWAKFLLCAGADAVGPEPVEGVAVAPADEVTADAFGRIAQSGFGFPAVTADWLAALVGRPGWHPYLATVQGEHVGAGAMFLRNGAAWLGIDATLPTHLGSGVQRALIARRVADALDGGATTLTAETAWPATPDDPNASSFRNYRHTGFEPVYARPNFRLAPPETVAPADPAA